MKGTYNRDAHFSYNMMTFLNVIISYDLFLEFPIKLQLILLESSWYKFRGLIDFLQEIDQPSKVISTTL